MVFTKVEMEEGVGRKAETSRVGQTERVRENKQGDGETVKNK